MKQTPNVITLINAIERILYMHIDTKIPENVLAIEVIKQAVHDYCTDDNYVNNRTHYISEGTVTGKEFIEGLGLILWAEVAGIDPAWIYDMVVRAKESLGNA